MSATYSSAERRWARLLAASPALKRLAKKGYQYLSWRLNKREHALYSAFPITAIEDRETAETFFGYYDKCPENRSGTHIIFQQVEQRRTRTEDPRRPLDVVVMDLATRNVIARLPSLAYNWQQGTKLQWLSNTRFGFNDYDPHSDRYVAKIYDVESRSLAYELEMPIYDCFGEEFALTLNYDRLARLSPDYGYFARMNRAMDIEDIENDGIFHLNIRTGETRLLMSLDALARITPVPSMRGASHTVNHIMIAPDGARALAIHRWYRSGRRFDRLVVLSLGHKTTATILADAGMVSHCFWIDATTVLGYLRGGDGHDAYWLIDIGSSQMTRLYTHGLDSYGDGHPHVRGQWFVTDTYPDKARMQHLLYCNLSSGEVTKLGEFFHGFAFDGETRCDLHPRLSADGRRVFFDSVFSGRRRLYSMDISAYLRTG